MSNPQTTFQEAFTNGRTLSAFQCHKVLRFDAGGKFVIVQGMLPDSNKAQSSPRVKMTLVISIRTMRYNCFTKQKRMYIKKNICVIYILSRHG